MPLPDSAQVRLTTSRYYIPSGRCIQKSYEDIENYSRDVINRYNRGELTHADSIHFPDSLKYKTASGRTVYGGGGVMPDIFIPMDTGKVSDYYYKLYRRNLFSQFVMKYLESHKAELLAGYPDFDTFYQRFKVDDAMLREFYDYARSEGVTDSMEFKCINYLNGFASKYKDTLDKIFPDLQSVDGNHALEQMFVRYVEEQQAAYLKRKAEFNTEKNIVRQLRTLLARNLYDTHASAKIWMETDDTYLEAVRVMHTPSVFRKMGIHDAEEGK